MQRWHKILTLIVVLTGGLAALLYTKNQPPQLMGTNYYEYYLNQDTQPVGRIGIFASHLVMPENYREEDFIALAGK